MRIIIKAIILLSFISCHNSLAGDLNYACKVIHIYNLDDDGSLKISDWEKQFRDSSFSVSRVTGDIIGEIVPTLLTHSTKIINTGNKEWSFKSIADFGTGAQLIEIQEFRQGDKPFIAMSMGGAGIVTGLCR